MIKQCLFVLCTVLLISNIYADSGLGRHAHSRPAPRPPMQRPQLRPMPPPRPTLLPSSPPPRSHHSSTGWNIFNGVLGAVNLGLMYKTIELANETQYLQTQQPIIYQVIQPQPIVITHSAPVQLIIVR